MYTTWTAYQNSSTAKAERKAFTSAMNKMEKLIKAGKMSTKAYQVARAIVVQIDGEDAAQYLETWFAV